MHRALKYGLLAAGATSLTGIVGAAIDPGAREAVLLGAGVAYAAQLVLFLGLFVWQFADRPLFAHGLAMVGRLGVVGMMALIWVPRATVPAAPLLFTLVAVFFVTTLLEPFCLSSLSTAR